MQMANRYISHIRNFLLRKRESILLSQKITTDTNKILLLKLDKIGDYILFRNFIKETFKQQPSSVELVLCGNIAWKELAEKLDGQFIHAFIWVDASRLGEDAYRFSVYKSIRRAKCNKVINCSYSRTNEYDKLVIYSGAKERVGFYGDETNILSEIKKVNDTKYTLLVSGPKECMFEFYRNKLFFEYLSGIKIQIDKPCIKPNQLNTDKTKQYIVVFPGAGHTARRWSASNYAQVCNSLFQLYNLPILICGAKNEAQYAEELLALSGPYVKNCTGQHSLYETIEVIQNALLVVANDSGPFHMAMAVMTPTICISNGNHFERFCPYPKEMNMPLIVIFPDEFETKMKMDVSHNSIRCKDSEININLITPDKVIHALKSSNLIKND